MRRPTILPDPEITPADQVRRRVKLQPRPDGLLQCPRCGSRSVLEIRNGVIVQDGRRVQRGTVIEKDACAECWKRGDTVQMVPGGQGPKLVR